MTPRWFACEACHGWGRVDEIEADGWHRRSGACPACNGTGEAVWADEQAEAA